jgi:zinc protease
MELKIFTGTLSNGLRVVVNEDDENTMVAAALLYEAGSRTEREGITGISHILEHMMYKGTEKIGPEEYSKRIQRLGGYDNAYTSKDYTVYYVYLPPGTLGEFLSMEGDRMVNLKLRDFKEEMEVIKDERRYSSVDNPIEYFMEEFWWRLFKVHPYRFPVIGLEDDLNRIKEADVIEYYQKFYTPANAILAVAGKVKFEEVMELADKYFSNVNKNSKPELSVPLEPEQRQKVEFEVKRKNSTPVIAIGFKIVPFGDPLIPVFDVLSEMLGGGKWGILVRELVYEKNVFASLRCETSYLKDHGVFVLVGVPYPGLDIKNAESILENKFYDALQQLGEDDLNTAKNKLLTEYYFDLESVRDLVFDLGEFELMGKIEDITKYPESLKSVTLEDVRKVFSQYFGVEKETVGVLNEG